MLSCCRKSQFCRRRIYKYQKFELAIERLADESDIVDLIQLNRVSRFLHKINFLSRQRKAVGRTHKFVITGQDILSSKKESSKRGQESKKEKSRTVNELLDGFDPFGDTASNELDRRLLFEVAGL